VAVVAVVVVRHGRSPAGDGPPKEDGRPNFVVFMTDDQTAESMRVMTRVKELIADRGVTFDNSFASFPLCCPSRATYLTGQYGHNHGVMGNVPPSGGIEAFTQPETTFVAALQKGGYRTVHIGKYLNGYGARVRPTIPPGWSDWFGSIDSSSYRYFGYQLSTKDGVVRHGNRPSDYQTDRYGELAAELVEGGRRGGRPFFVNVAFLAPHNEVKRGEDEGAGGSPVPAPRHAGTLGNESLPDTAAFDEADVTDKPKAVQNLPQLSGPVRNGILAAYRARLESLLAVDEAVGRVVEALRRSGELQRTVLMFTSDNGFMHGEHRIPRGKAQVYDPSTRVPLLISGPGLAQGKTRSAVVANIDLAPTILDLAGVEPLRPVDGRSLVPLARGTGTYGDRAVLLEMGGSFGRTLGVRTERHLYVERPTGEKELYASADDPEQLENRAADPALADIRADLTMRLARLRRCAEATCQE